MKGHDFSRADKLNKKNRALAPEGSLSAIWIFTTDWQRQMGRRESIRFRELEALETEFRELLIPCLRQCIAGRWGIFGTYDPLGADRRYRIWPEADRLRELAISIREIRRELGEGNALREEFLRLCTLHRANDPGEPKAAKAFLQSLGALQQKEEV